MCVADEGTMFGEEERTEVHGGSVNIGTPIVSRSSTWALCSLTTQQPPVIPATISKRDRLMDFVKCVFFAVVRFLSSG